MTQSALRRLLAVGQWAVSRAVTLSWPFLKRYFAVGLVVLLASPTAIGAVDVNIDASVPDDTPPSVAVTSPTAGQTFASGTQPTIAGTAADNSNGIGLATNSTTYTLQRSSDGLYWNGISWVSAPAALATTHPATNQNEEAAWSATGPLPTFAADTYTVVAKAVDKSANETTSAPVTFTVSAAPVTPPTPPVPPGPGAALPPPEITDPTNGELVTDATPLITGTGQSGATITVTIVETGASYTATVAVDGTWSLVIATPLPAGEYTLTATQTVGAQTSAADTETFEVGLPAPAITSPTAGEVVTDTTPFVTGTGIPGATIDVTIVETGETYRTTVAGDGTWSVTIDQPLIAGSYTLSVTQLFNGLTSEPTTRSFSVRTAAATTLTGLITSIPGSAQANAVFALLLAIGALVLSALPALLQLPVGLPVAPPLFNLFALFMGWLQRRRKYGIVYDSVSREGVEGVTVRLFAEGGTEFEQGKLLETKVTDERGRYTFNVEDGAYRIEVIKAEYLFPSNRASLDYRGEVQQVDKGLYHPDIPIDALTPAKHHALVNFRSLGHRIQQVRLPIMIIGTLLAIAYLVERTHVIDMVIVALYVVIWTFEFLQYMRARNVAYVYAHRQPAPLTILRLFDDKGRLHTTRVTNLDGQYSIFAAKGTYLLDVLKQQYDVQSHELTMKEPGIVPKRVTLRKLPDAPR